MQANAATDSDHSFLDYLYYSSLDSEGPSGHESVTFTEVTVLPTHRQPAPPSQSSDSMAASLRPDGGHGSIDLPRPKSKSNLKRVILRALLRLVNDRHSAVDARARLLERSGVPRERIGSSKWTDKDCDGIAATLVREGVLPIGFQLDDVVSQLWSLCQHTRLRVQCIGTSADGTLLSITHRRKWCQFELIR